jgi:hypothetical protein
MAFVIPKFRVSRRKDGEELAALTHLHIVFRRQKV